MEPTIAITRLVRGVLIVALQVASVVSGSPALAQPPSNSPIVIHGDKAYPPYESLVDGKPVGLNVDLWEAIANVLDRTLDYRLYQWENSQERVKRGEGKVLSFMSFNKKRGELYDFTEPTFSFKYPVFVHADSADSFDILDLTGKRIAVKKGGFPRTILETLYPEAEIVFVDSPLDGFRKLLRNEVDGVVEDEIVGYAILRQYGFKSIRATAKSLASKTGHIAVVKGNPKLVLQINEALKILKENGKFDQVADKWHDLETVIIKKDQLQLILIAASITLILLVSLGGIVYSIRLRKINAALRESEARLSLHIQNTPLGCISWDANFVCTEWNKSAEKIFGFSAEEAIGHHAAGLIVAAENRAEIDVVFKSLLQQTGGSLNTNDNGTKDGRNLTCEWYNTPIVNMNNEIAGVASLVLDITERKASEDRVKISEAALIKSEAVANSGHWSWDAETQEVTWSLQCFHVFGRDPETWMPSGDNFREDMPAEDSNSLEEANARGFKSGEPFTVEYRYYKGGSREQIIWVEASCDFVRSEVDGKIIEMVGFVKDITERKTMEKQARQAQKMEAVGQLTGGIAHDFNNMLGVIMGNLDLLRRRVTGDDKSTEYVEEAYKGSKRGANITKKLLAFSMGDEGNVELLDVNEFISDMENLIAKSLTPKIKIESHLSENIWSTNIDSGDFENTLLNLSLNANDAMPDGGLLTIETSNKVLDEQYAKMNPGCHAGEYVLISVSDTGTGMTPGTMEQLFEPFFTTKGKGEGTGLGLSMVYGFVQRSGGHIKVYSEIDRGSTLRIFLPRGREETEGATKTNNSTNQEPPRGNETILVVDDEKGLVKVAVSYLQELGYSTYTSASAKGALEVLQGHPQIDLLFTDIVMPGSMDGYGLAKEALKSYPDLKILMTSGFTSERESAVNGDVVLFAKLSGDLLSKPYNHLELAVAIRQILDEGDSS